MKKIETSSRGKSLKRETRNKFPISWGALEFPEAPNFTFTDCSACSLPVSRGGCFACIDQQIAYSVETLFFPPNAAKPILVGQMLMFLTVPFFLGFLFCDTHTPLVWELRPCSLGILKCCVGASGNARQSPGWGVLPDSGKPGVEGSALHRFHIPASTKVLCRGHWLRASCRGRGARCEDLQEEEHGSSSPGPHSLPQPC